MHFMEKVYSLDRKIIPKTLLFTRVNECLMLSCLIAQRRANIFDWNNHYLIRQKSTQWRSSLRRRNLCTVQYHIKIFNLAFVRLKSGFEKIFLYRREMRNDRLIWSNCASHKNRKQLILYSTFSSPRLAQKINTTPIL